MGQKMVKSGQNLSQLFNFFPNCALERNFSKFFRAASRLKLCVKTEPHCIWPRKDCWLWTHKKLGNLKSTVTLLTSGHLLMPNSNFAALEVTVFYLPYFRWRGGRSQNAQVYPWNIDRFEGDARKTRRKENFRSNWLFDWNFTPAPLDRRR